MLILGGVFICRTPNFNTRFLVSRPFYHPKGRQGGIADTEMFMGHTTAAAFRLSRPSPFEGKCLRAKKAAKQMVWKTYFYLEKAGLDVVSWRLMLRVYF